MVQNSYYQLAILTVKKLQAWSPPSRETRHHKLMMDGDTSLSPCERWRLSTKTKVELQFMIPSCSVWLQLVNSFSCWGFPTERYYNWLDNWGLCSWPRTQQQINHRYNQQCVMQARYNNHKPPRSFELVKLWSQCHKMGKNLPIIHKTQAKRIINLARLELIEKIAICKHWNKTIIVWCGWPESSRKERQLSP